MKRAALILAAASLAGASHAVTINGLGGASIEYVTGGVRIADGSGVSFQGRHWETPSNGNARLRTGPSTLQVGGNPIAVTARHNVPRAAIQRAMARTAATVLPPVAVGVALWDIWDAMRVRPDGQGGLMWDEGVPEETIQSYPYNGTSAFGASNSCNGTASHQAAADCIIAKLNATNHGDIGSTIRTYNGATYASGDATSQSFTVHYTNCTTYTNPVQTICNNTAHANGITTQRGTLQTTTQCPASVDFSNPANSLPAGLPPGPDGMCRTGRYDHPKSFVQAADFMEQHAPLADGQLSQYAEDVLARGGSIEGAGPHELSGPASVPGTPRTSTTTAPDGTVTTTTRTPSTNYTYNNNTITYNVTTVTVTNVDGDETTTVDDQVPEQSEHCKANPDSLGCSKYGEPPTDAPQWQHVEVPYSPETVGPAGSCPPPVTWQVFGLTLSWTYDKVCDVAPIVRLGLLLLASFGAIGVIVRETST